MYPGAVLFDPEIVWPEIQGSRFRWRNETRDHEHLHRDRCSLRWKGWWRARVKMYSTGDSMAKSLAGLIDNDNLTEDAEMKKKKFL
jgi:hypothetical protein